MNAAREATSAVLATTTDTSPSSTGTPAPRPHEEVRLQRVPAHRAGRRRLVHRLAREPDGEEEPEARAPPGEGEPPCLRLEEVRHDLGQEDQREPPGQLAQLGDERGRPDLPDEPDDDEPPRQDGERAKRLHGPSAGRRAMPRGMRASDWEGTAAHVPRGSRACHAPPAGDFAPPGARVSVRASAATPSARTSGARRSPGGGRSGELVGLMVSARARSGSDTVRERSNVVMVAGPEPPDPLHPGPGGADAPGAA